VVRPGRASALGGVVVYGGSGSCGVGGDVVLGDLSDERMTDKDVVDQFLASSVDSAESLLGRDAGGEVPKPLRVTFVGAVKAGGADLRAGRPVDDLSSGGLHLVVEVAGSWPGRRGLLSCRCRSMSASSMVAGMNPNSAVSSRTLFISNIAATSSSRTHRPSGTGELPEGGYVRQRRGTGYQVVRVGRVYQDLLVVAATTPLPRPCPSLTDHGGALPWRSGR
jgi:hypothetical protein